VLAINTSMQTTQHPFQLQNTEAQEDLEQDFEEKIEAIIKDELVHIRQENEHLRLMQEKMVRRKAMTKRAQAMQQQIDQERAIQAELQQAIEHLRHQECEPTVQEPPMQHHQPQQPQQNPPRHTIQSSIDSKCSLADNMQLAPWPAQYKAAPPPKYYGESDP
jgi:hypothetical protein